MNSLRHGNDMFEDDCGVRPLGDSEADSDEGRGVDRAPFADDAPPSTSPRASSTSRHTMAPKKPPRRRLFEDDDGDGHGRESGDPAREGYMVTMRRMQAFFETPGDAESIKTLVSTQLRNRMIRLTNPDFWFWVICGESDVTQVRGRDFSAYLGDYDGGLVMIGLLAAQGLLKWGSHYVMRETSCILLLSELGKVYVYDHQTDGLTLIAHSLLELAAIGLLRCEAVYRHPHTPLATTEPRDIVSTMIDAWEDQDALDVVRALGDHCHRDLVFNTPGGLTRALKIVTDMQSVCMYLPYAVMDEEDVRNLWGFIDCTVRCRWHVIGLTGTYDDKCLFISEEMVLLDSFGIVYAFDHCSLSVIRIADDVPMLLRIGMRKLSDARFDRNYRGQARLERRVLRSEVRTSSDDNWMFLKARNVTVTPLQRRMAHIWFTDMECAGLDVKPWSRYAGAIAPVAVHSVADQRRTFDMSNTRIVLFDGAEEPGGEYEGAEEAAYQDYPCEAVPDGSRGEVTEDDQKYMHVEHMLTEDVIVEIPDADKEGSRRTRGATEPTAWREPDVDVRDACHFRCPVAAGPAKFLPLRLPLGIRSEDTDEKVLLRDVGDCKFEVNEDCDDRCDMFVEEQPFDTNCKLTWERTAVFRDRVCAAMKIKRLGQYRKAPFVAAHFYRGWFK